ncbi:sialic acid-binding Ig-like lectin 15 [Ambystoma mexicanum]|uniref:sialic acid-binding Ig-like lectin 15 n=1 Tax=Ambystoma mexicanum TaxID=8296 RepID=UPI0037E86560
MRRLGLFAACLSCILQQGTKANGWSFQIPPEVTGVVGKMAALLCTFTHPHKNYNGSMTVIWRVKEPYNGTIVFKCISHSSHEPCKTTLSFKNKYKLLGNPRSNNASIRVDNLTWSDGERYFCRVELSTDRHDKYETKVGTRLHLVAPPRILNITVGFDTDRGYNAQCLAEGEPLPSLQWTGPWHVKQANHTPVARTSLGHQVTELHYLTQDGKYTCIATNSHGKAEGTVYFFKFKSGSDSSPFLILLYTTIAIKILILFIILGVAAYVRQDNTTEQPHLTRQHVQESTYENFDGRAE